MWAALVGLPLSPECEIVHTVTVGSHMQVTGEVKRIIAEESILNEKGRVVLEKLRGGLSQ